MATSKHSSTPAPDGANNFTPSPELDYTAHHRDEVLGEISVLACILRDHLARGVIGEFDNMPADAHKPFNALAYLIGALADSVTMRPVLGNVATWAIGDEVQPVEVKG